jgi:2-polyprenyl-6-methoxyphenol hydroxylase-like FAD-dependent oxidoreductase
VTTTASSPAVRRALVVGAGPAGLAAAISMRRHGVEVVDVAEITDRRAVIGSELSVASAMLRALDRIGAAHAVAAAGVAIDQAQMCLADGTLLGAVPFPQIAGPELPGAVGIARAVLHEVLWDAAEAAGARLRLGASVTRIESGDTVGVSFADGSHDRYDLVVGADGVRSTVRELVFPDAPVPWYSGQIAWRARVPRRTGPMLAVYNAADRKAGLITVSPTDSYLFLLVNTPEPGRPDREDFPALLRSALAGFGGPVSEIRDDITDPAAIHYSPLNPVLVPAPWHRGRVILIGDAAHATTPHLAYGAGLAVEDGVILGETLAGAPDVETALKAFTERRWERCRMVVENGLQIQRWELQGPGAGDPGGLTMRSQMAIAQPA